jgi:hypothetical protein
MKQVSRKRKATEPKEKAEPKKKKAAEPKKKGPTSEAARRRAELNEEIDRAIAGRKKKPINREAVDQISKSGKGVKNPKDAPPAVKRVKKSGPSNMLKTQKRRPKNIDQREKKEQKVREFIAEWFVSQYKAPEGVNAGRISSCHLTEQAIIERNGLILPSIVIEHI